MKILYQSKIIPLLLLVSFPVFSQEYEIKIAVNSPGDTVIMGYYFAKNSSMIPEDTCILDKSGKGVFRGKQKLDRGLYFFIINKRKKFDFVMGDEQKFEIKADTSDLISNTTAKGSKENEIFFDFQRTNLRQGVQLHELRQALEAAEKEGNREKQTEIRARMQELHKDRIAYLQQLIDAHPGLFVTKFLNTLIPTEQRLPDYPRDEAGNITDSTYLYRWYRAHFFDDLNIYDPDMLRTPLYEEKLMTFFAKIPQHPDTIIAEADKILEKTLSEPAVFRCVLVLLFNHYTKSQIMVHENIWVHLAKKWYIPHASWAAPDYVENLKKEVDKRASNLIGMHAPPMEMLMTLPPDHFRAAALDTAIKFDLHAGINIKDFRQSLKGKYTAILFWDISCSHCRKTIQDLYAEYEKLKDKGLTVITVMTVPTKESKGKWVDFINEHQMFGWTNGWSPYSAKYRTTYDVAQTPLLFLLDENENIIGKRLTPDQLGMLIN
ncbi:MAG: redoxin domain-containing protein [Bacteroidales bacterium]|nr:redoxin domain-containing protein [Bacteroidales bacterium]